MQSVLDTAPSRADDGAKSLFEALLAPTATNRRPPANVSPSASPLPQGETWDNAATATLADFLDNGEQIAANTAAQLSHDWRVAEPPQVIETRAGSARWRTLSASHNRTSRRAAPDGRFSWRRRYALPC